ncbi:hypothetical protein [Ferruginibacter sp.]
MDNNSILIDRYLQNEMSADEKITFEEKLVADKNLQEEFNIQKQVIKAAENAGLKNEFVKAIKKRILAKKIIRWGIIAAIGIAAFIFYAVKTDLFLHIAKGEKGTAAQGFPAPEKFDIDNAADTIIETKDGVVFAIPANAFSSNNVQLEIRTALTPEDIIKSGLSTMSNGDLLQTAGMFSIKGFAGDKELSLLKEIAVSVPAKEINPAMQLFDGVPDSTGKINWVNPKPIEKRLQTYDITTLDFYPPKYIPTLKALGKNYQNKKYTDSLYYSFSGWPQTNESSEYKAIFSQGNVEAADFPETVDTLKPSKFDYASDSLRLPIEFDKHNEIYQIDPAIIRAIWDKKFNNTIIATKEFAERLRYMHSLCTSKFLDIYFKNLDKPLYISDELCAKMPYGDAENKFLEFAARKDGGVIIANGLQQKLSNYFQQKSKAYREAVEKTWAKYNAELQRLDTIADTKSRDAAIRNFAREENNFKEELCINLTDAYKQIGVKRNCNDTIVPPADKFYNVTITATGWKNLDAYVMEATVNRQSMEYKDPATGKVAKLIYQQVNFKIDNEEQFDRVLVYLIPDSLSSFQLVQKKKNSYKENLNSLFKYDAVVLAYKGEQAYFYRQSNVEPKEYTFFLSPLTEAELKAALKIYSFSKVKELNTEFEYQLFQQQEVLRQLQLRKDQQFREKVAESIFSCYDVAPPEPGAIEMQFKK